MADHGLCDVAERLDLRGREQVDDVPPHRGDMPGRRTGLPFGWIVIAVGALVLLLWVPLRQRPGIGTVSNVIVVGLAADVALDLIVDGRLQSTGHLDESATSVLDELERVGAALAPLRATTSATA